MLSRHAGLVEKRDQPRQMLVGMVEHAGEGRLQPREDALLVGAVLVPRLHAVIARRHPVSRRHEPIAFCRASRCSRSTSQPCANISS